MEQWRKAGESAGSEGLSNAASSFETARRLNPQLTEALVGQGVVASWQGDRAKAERLLRQAVTEAPTNPEARKALEDFLRIAESWRRDGAR
jgi:cytochrome c-type biogenesis protein CcmH/NrfG